MKDKIREEEKKITKETQDLKNKKYSIRKIKSPPETSNRKKTVQGVVDTGLIKSDGKKQYFRSDTKNTDISNIHNINVFQG